MIRRITELAEKLKQEYGTNNPSELCRCLGITLLRADLPRRINGFYMETAGKQAVVISSAIKEPLDSACTAHELGHALLHKGVNTVFLTDSTNFVTGRYEREADLFAAALLIDIEDTRQNCGSIEEIAKMTGVPSYAVEQYMSLCVNYC